MRHPPDDAKRKTKKRPSEDDDDDEEASTDEDEPLEKEKEAPPKKKKKRAREESAGGAAPHKRERSKSLNTVAARMKQVVDHMVASQKAGELHPTLTVFLYKSPQSEIVNAFFSEMQRENQALFDARDELLALIAQRYDEFVAGFAST